MKATKPGPGSDPAAPHEATLATTVTSVTTVTAGIEAAQGKRECDTLIKDAKILDVFRQEWRSVDLALFEGRIVACESKDRGGITGVKAKRVIEAKGKWIVPGFVDAHVHLESSLMTPENFQRSVLPKGTTTVVSDPHELANVCGEKGIQYFLGASTQMALDLRVMMSSCVPATHFETNGGGEIGAETLARLGKHPNALGLAEVMNVPGVLHGAPNVIDKLQAFMGRPIDGHCPKLTGLALSAYASAGISSCHESSEYNEALEKLEKGIRVWIREGSVAKDLDALIPLLNASTSPFLGFCTDDRNPLDIEREGHIDHLVRKAIKSGVQSAVAFRAASHSVAAHYGLDRGWDRVGALAPGYRADLVFLSDANSVAIDQVWKSGRPVNELDFKVVDSSGLEKLNSIKAVLPEAKDLEGPAGQVHVMGVLPGKIITEHLILDSKTSGVARMAVLERYGRGSKPACGYVRGFGVKFQGAIASSVGHDSHNLAVIGSDSKDMRVALASLMECGGGFAVVRDGKVLARLELPLGGLISTESPSALSNKLKKLHEASRALGCELEEPFLQLAFLCLPVIPSLKLTDRGLIDVDKFEQISVSA